MTHDEAVKTLEQFLEYDRDAVSGWTIGHAQDAIREVLAENERLLHLATTEENRARDAEEENDRLRAVREGTMKPTETPDGLYAKTADMMEPALKPKVPDLKAAVERAQIKFTFEQRQRLTEEIEPACADDTE